MYKFDTITCTWSRVSVSGSAPCPRSYHSLVSHGACLYVFGGCPQEGRLADLHSLDTETGVWTKLEAGPMEGRGGTPLAVTRDGDIFVVGGFAGREMADIHKYSIKEGKWTTMKEVRSTKWNPNKVFMTILFQTLPAARSVALCVEMSGRLVLVGGELAPSARGHAGAGNFSDQATILGLEGAGVRLEGESEGPRARGWSAGGVWLISFFKFN